MFEDNAFGEYLKQFREENNLSTNELHKITGVSQPYISQLENGGKKPSRKIIHRIASGLSRDDKEKFGEAYKELLEKAGYTTDWHYLNETPFYNSMTPEEEIKYEEDNLKRQIKNWNVKQYQEKIHVRLEDFLNDTSRNLYIDDHKLTNEEIGMLITLYGGKEKDYPSDEQIEKEYEEIKKINEENEKRIADGEIILAMSSRYDINTNEDV